MPEGTAGRGREREKNKGLKKKKDYDSCWLISPQFGKIHFVIWTNTFSNLNKYNVRFGQKKTLFNLGKYMLQFGHIVFQFGQLQLAIWKNCIVIWRNAINNLEKYSGSERRVRDKNKGVKKDYDSRQYPFHLPHNLDKYIWQFGQIDSAFHTNKFGVLDKYSRSRRKVGICKKRIKVWKMVKIHVVRTRFISTPILTNTFGNLDKYISQFGQIELV